MVFFRIPHTLTTFTQSQVQPVTRPSYLIDNVLQLQDRHSDQPILAGKAVILDARVQLEELQLFLVANDAVAKKKKV